MPNSRNYETYEGFEWLKNTVMYQDRLWAKLFNNCIVMGVFMYDNELLGAAYIYLGSLLMFSQPTIYI